MTEQLKQTMTEEIAKLPKIKQDAINTSGWIETTEEAGKKFLLKSNEIEILQVETGLVLIGLVDLDAYATNLENNIRIDSNEAKKMATDIFEKVFTPVAKKIEISLKDRLTSKTPSWEESVNFIISGGDYSHFIEK